VGDRPASADYGRAAAIITVGDWSVRKAANGMGFACAIYAILYAFFAYLVARWRRGICRSRRRCR